MSGQILSGIGCVLLGTFPLVAWWFAMFSDSDWGEAAREMLDGAFNLGRNTVAVIEPAVGGFLFFGGMLLLAQAAGFDGEDPVALVFGVPGVVGGCGVGFDSGAAAGVDVSGVA